MDYFEKVGVILDEVNLISITVRLLLSIIIGGIIGGERGRRRRPAGLKTHTMVCMGAALVMITSQYLWQQFGGMGDIARMGAQVVSGIGFLGAGTIMVTRKNQIKGLTTAAGLWYAGCIGLAVGIGFYEGAILACVFELVAMKVLYRIDMRIEQKSAVVEYYIEVTDTAKISDIIMKMRQNQCKIMNIEIGNDEYGQTGSGLLLTLMLNKENDHTFVQSVIGEIDGVRYVQEMQ